MIETVFAILLRPLLLILDFIDGLIPMAFPPDRWAPGAVQSKKDWEFELYKKEQTFKAELERLKHHWTMKDEVNRPTTPTPSQDIDQFIREIKRTAFSGVTVHEITLQMDLPYPAPGVPVVLSLPMNGAKYIFPDSAALVIKCAAAGIKIRWKGVDAPSVR